MINRNNLIKDNIEKLHNLIEIGINPYPYNYKMSTSIHHIRANFMDYLNSNEEVSIASRVFSIRKVGKNLIFCDMAATTSQVRKNQSIQVLINKNNIDNNSSNTVNNLSVGDWIGIKGVCILSKTNEPTILVKEIVMLSKSIRSVPFPKLYKHGNEEKEAYGVNDKEILWRYPELDMLIRGKAEVLLTRYKIIMAIREYLSKNLKCIEIETPYININYGGAEAAPFITHLNALNMEVFLAISPEIELKRAIVGGLGTGGDYGKGVYTIARNFRNEGIDKSHNPEFTSMEVYLPFVDYHTMMNVTEEIFKQSCIAANGTAECTYNNQKLDFSKPWPRYSVVDLVKDKTGIDVAKLDRNSLVEKIIQLELNIPIQINQTASTNEFASKISKLNKLGIAKFYSNEVFSSEELIDSIIQKHGLHKGINIEQEWDFLVLDMFEIFCEPFLLEPCHVILHPAKSTVLCKEYRHNPLPNGELLIERFESYVMGMEVSNAYSELNNALIQRELFEKQVSNRIDDDIDAVSFNEFFINSLEIGLPPCGGLGIGIDRLVMLLTNSLSIRDVIAFPMVGR